MAEDNEIVAVARGAEAARHGATKAEQAARERRWRLGQLGLGQIGLGAAIGSAAVAAAVLYARRERD